MSDDEVDLELLDLLRQRLGISNAPQNEVSSDTGVLRDAEFIYNNSIDVFINMHATKAAAAGIYKSMQERAYSTQTWSQHELHPRPEEGFTEVDIVNFVFTLDLLNFSFWSELSEADRFQVEYRGKRWTGYNSLVACLRRALDEEIPITTPRFWRSRQCSDELLAGVFRSATREQIPLLEGRIANLREASQVLGEEFADEDEDEDLASLDHIDLDHDGSNQIAAIEAKEAHKIDEPEPATERHVAKEQLSSSQTHDGDILAEEQPQKLPLNSKQPQPSTEGGEGCDPESTTASGPNAEIDSLHVLPPHMQTDASVSPTRAPKSLPQLQQTPDYAVVRLIERSGNSAGKLVNLLAKHFPFSFRDEARFDGKRVRLLKRAQIFVADLWAALNANGLGEFGDIDHLTMFPDYRVAQMLHGLGVLSYSPPLDYRVNNCVPIDSGHSWEVQIRGCSIWAVELLRREILKNHPETHVNAVLLDFFLYDLAKEREANAGTPHHRTRSVWY